MCLRGRLLLTVAIFEHNAIGLICLVLGLWKLGFPDTISSAVCAYSQGPTMKGLQLFFDSMGTALHHSATSMVIVCLTTGMFPRTQAVLAPCIVPVMQHWLSLMRYNAPNTRTLLIIALELFFQFELLSYLHYFETGHGKLADCFARGVAVVMIMSHWVSIK
jgi:hypothetical protein